MLVCSLYGILGMWDVQGVRCWRRRMFKIYYVCMWNVWVVGGLGCGMFEMWNVHRCEMLGI